MQSLISTTLTAIGSLLNTVHIKQFVSTLIIGVLILSTNVDPDLASKGAIDRLEVKVQQEDTQRPKTTRQWQRQAREVEGRPGERAKRIGEQSADAIKEFGEVYPKVADESANELENSVNSK